VKNISRFFLIIFLLFIPFNTVYGNDKIAFINLEFLFENTNLGKKISTDLKLLNSKNIDQLKIEEKKLIDEENKIKKTQNILSEDELKSKISNLKKEVNSFNKKKKDIFQSFDEEKNKQLNMFFQKITPIIENYMADNSINLLLEKKNIFIGKSNIDITDDILILINNKLN
tara:strand:- start:374 stop:886 length:513 start_codon:yes stop_codon:yes gene_type:complete